MSKHQIQISEKRQLIVQLKETFDVKNLNYVNIQNIKPIFLKFVILASFDPTMFSINMDEVSNSKIYQSYYSRIFIFIHHSTHGYQSKSPRTKNKI